MLCLNTCRGTSVENFHELNFLIDEQDVEKYDNRGQGHEENSRYDSFWLVK